MADIFFLNEKTVVKWKKLFVDYWFGVEFDDENTNGELANTEAELIDLLKTFEIPTT